MADEVDISTDVILRAAEERAAAIRASLQHAERQSPMPSAVHLASRLPKRRGGRGDE